MKTKRKEMLSKEKFKDLQLVEAQEELLEEREVDSDEDCPSELHKVRHFRKFIFKRK